MKTIPNLLFVLFLMACSYFFFSCSAEKKEQEATHKQQSNKQIPKEKALVGKDYQRIVTIGNVVSETVLALVDTSRVVAIHNKLPFLPNFDRPKVGSRGMLRSKYILAHKPDAVFSNIQGSADSIMNQVKKAKVDYHRFKTPEKLEDTKKLIQEIAQRLNKEQEGKQILAQIDSNQTAIRNLVSQQKDSLRVLYVHARGPHTILVGGKNTPAHELINLAGAKNPAEDLEGMKRIDEYDMLGFQAHYLLMSKKSMASIVGKTEDATILFNSTAYRLGRVIVMEEHEILHCGLNTARCAYQLASKVYPTVQ